MVRDSVNNELLTFLPIGVSVYSIERFSIAFKDSTTNGLYGINYRNNVDASCLISGGTQDLEIFGVIRHNSSRAYYASLHESGGTFKIVFTKFGTSCSISDTLIYELASQDEFSVAFLDGDRGGSDFHACLDSNANNIKWLFF